MIVNPENNTPYEVISRQYLLGIALEKVINETRSDIVAFRSRPETAVGQISRSRSVLRNASVVAGTRIPVKAITRLSEDGYTVDQIIAEYPDLRPEDVEAALKHGKSNVAA
ncbi:MAG: DUF433 domain-containing protein [Candidatus Acidiferrales bacterium]